MGPIPGSNLTFKFIAHGTIRISENIIAASKPNRVIGCIVTVEACSGFKHNEIKSFCDARMARYSFKYLPSLSHHPNRSLF